MARLDLSFLELRFDKRALSPQAREGLGYARSIANRFNRTSADVAAAVGVEERTVRRRIARARREILAQQAPRYCAAAAFDLCWRWLPATATVRRQFCSARCRTAAWRARRAGPYTPRT